MRVERGGSRWRRLRCLCLAGAGLALLLLLLLLGLLLLDALDAALLLRLELVVQEEERLLVVPAGEGRSQ